MTTLKKKPYSFFLEREKCVNYYRCDEDYIFTFLNLTQLQTKAPIIFQVNYYSHQIKAKHIKIKLKNDSKIIYILTSYFIFIYQSKYMLYACTQIKIQIASFQ
uniref:Transmembrane protein n=1 Tax=Schizaphis graminum TaxID=13262 RepID=A0A2S2NJ60_SCHGA